MPFPPVWHRRQNVTSKLALLSPLHIHPGLASGTRLGLTDFWLPAVTAFRTCLVSHMSRPSCTNSINNFSLI